MWNHSVFRCIEKRDTVWRKAQRTEEEAFVQWKEVLRDLNIEVIYAMSPAPKGKVERPYRWLQDHMVRISVREGIKRIEETREILYREIFLFNNKRVNSTTGGIPSIRFEKALKDKKSLFRPFIIRKPYESQEDIFCYRSKRTVDPYPKISINNLKFGISGIPIGEEVELKTGFNLKTRIPTIRFWYQGNLVGPQQVKAEDLKGVQF